MSKKVLKWKIMNKKSLRIMKRSLKMRRKKGRLTK